MHLLLYKSALIITKFLELQYTWWFLPIFNFNRLWSGNTSECMMSYTATYNKISFSVLNFAAQLKHESNQVNLIKWQIHSYNKNRTKPRQLGIWPNPILIKIKLFLCMLKVAAFLVKLNQVIIPFWLTL